MISVNSQAGEANKKTYMNVRQLSEIGVKIIIRDGGEGLGRAL
jgi:hypothetical protein